MSNIAIRKRRQSTTNLGNIVIGLGDVFVDITKDTLVVGDGSTLGGVPLAKENHTHANATSMTAGFMSPTDKGKLDALSISGGIQTVESAGTPVTSRTIANFSTDFSLTDNSGASRTEFAISQGFRDEINDDIVALILAIT